MRKRRKDFYLTLSEACDAVKALNITSESEYRRYYKADVRLPPTLALVYSKEWQSWPQFFGKDIREPYGTLEQARYATKRLGITSISQYRVHYKQDCHLPAKPYLIYSSEWQSWYHFFYKDKPSLFDSFSNASAAAQQLNIKSGKEYIARYKENSRLPSDPRKAYPLEWRNWKHFLIDEKLLPYILLAEACAAVKKLNINSNLEYKERHMDDPRLPCKPSKTYAAEWQGWHHFLGKEKYLPYSTLIEASIAAQQLNINTSLQYKLLYKKDPRLPAHPEEFYAKDWQSMEHFLGKDIKKPTYSSLAEASAAVQVLKIGTVFEYKARFREDPLLPASPNSHYPNDWKNWHDYFGRQKRVVFKSLLEASAAAQQLNIQSREEYVKRYKENNGLTATPERIYVDEWLGWSHFLGILSISFYGTLAEASSAAKRLNIKSLTEYKTRYKEDQRLPSSPSQVYLNEWQDWEYFLGRKRCNFYETLSEARLATQKLMLISKQDYINKYKLDSRLPRSPNIYYSTGWISWLDFLLPLKITNIEQLKLACKVLQIKDSGQYRVVRREYKILSAHPERLSGWVDWYDLLDIPIPYKYEDLIAIVRKAGCQTLDDYKKFRAEADDPRLPASPIETYAQSGWTNTYDFFGKPRPYQVQYLTAEWRQWGDCITRFLKQARGSGTKAQELCQFVRDYIQAEGLESSPHEFLTRTKANLKPLLELLNQLHVHKKKRMLYSINEFLDWIIQVDLTIEDEATGEIVRLKSAANPFKNLNFNNEQSVPTINETAKPSLPYQFVKSGRDWIFPPDSVMKSLSYADFHHLHKFTADWIAIDDPSILDLNDPDCVTKTDRGKILLWNPIFWTYTYALMQLPARGMQIIYCDSGEMDDEIPYFEKGQLLWRKNQLPHAGSLKKQGMIYKTENNDFGVHYTSNKTQLFGEGYYIPYMPLELAYWLIKLRDWQQKYNPLYEPTPWLDCKRTNLNELQRLHKGENSFLFRDFGDVEPGTYGGRLADRLAASLFFSVGDEGALATYRDCSFKEIGQYVQSEAAVRLSRFSSSFTPHTMRVSLINAYAFEFGLPIEVIMKLVGHASIVMSVYYLKSGLVRQKVELGEKQAFRNAPDNARRFIEEHGIEDYRSQLTANNPDFLKSLSNSHSEVVYLWKDFGVCPVGGNSCSSGGEPVAAGASLNHPVPAGYIGEQNCLRCRFFVTGPAFLMGLVALYNEITLAVSSQALLNTAMHDELTEVGAKIDVISNKQYENKKDEALNRELDTQKELMKAKRRKLNSEIETRSKKLDMLMTDLNFLYRHIQNSKTLASTGAVVGDDTIKLIVPNQLQFDVELEESTQFHILSEVCENAELFHSCSSELAVAKRNQALDKFMINNDMPPQLMFLNEQEQVIVGNQLTKLMYARINSWETIDRLISGELSLKDLDGDVHLSARDIKTLFANAKPLPIRGLV